LKNKVIDRNKLVSERKAVLVRINAGFTFFSQITIRTPQNDIREAHKMMNGYQTQLNELDSKIFALDTIICSRLEAEFLDSIIKVRTKRTQNDAGDTIKSAEFFFMPDDYSAEDYITINEDELWFLKIMKQAFTLQTIDIIGKEQRNEKIL